MSLAKLREQAAAAIGKKPDTAPVRGSASGRPTLAHPPKCGRCGTAVDAGQKYCEVCGPIMATRTGPVAFAQMPVRPPDTAVTLEGMTEQVAEIKR